MNKSAQVAKEEADLIHHKRSITRNADGIAIIPVSSGGEKTYALVDDDLWFSFIKKSWSLPHNRYVSNGLRPMHHLVMDDVWSKRLAE